MKTPSEKYNMPVIGTITTKPMEVEWTSQIDGSKRKEVFPSETYEVIAKDGETYICNQWHKPDVPQLVHSSQVQDYKEKTQSAYAKLIVLANSGKDALADTFGYLGIIDVVAILQDLLKGEYRQRDVYECYRYLLFGAAGIGVKEHLEEHMIEEMEHVDILQRYLVSLNQVPTTERLPIPVPLDYTLRSLMIMNLELEKDAVDKYSTVIQGLEALNNKTHIALLNDLQNIVSQEQEHCHDLERWIKETL